MAGYNEMLRQIEPEQIICYNTPFPGMEGNIVHVDYDRSSWRYMNYERSLPKEDLDCYKIGGAIHKEYDIMEPYRIGKGGGSAYGGGYKPAKPEDERSGMGFTIMQSFMDGFSVDSRKDEGTRVTMWKRIGAVLPCPMNAAKERMDA